MNVKAATQNPLGIPICKLHRVRENICNISLRMCPQIGGDDKEGTHYYILPSDCPNRVGFTSNGALKKLVTEWRETRGYSGLVSDCADDLEAVIKVKEGKE